MVSVGQVFDVIDLIAAPTSLSADVTEVMREEFCAAIRASDSDLDLELSAGEIIGGLRDAIYGAGIGLWVDHQEPFTINEQAQRAIELHIGVTNPGTATFYTYDGDDVAEGLAGFDEWLQADHATKYQQRVDNGDPQDLIDTMKNMRLIGVTTGADYALSVLYPNANIDDLVDALGAIGVKTSRQQAPAPPPPSSYNIGELIWDHLVEQHSYQDRSELTGKKLSGVLTRIVDGQHAITVNIVPFKRGPRHGKLARFHLSISRDDINDLGNELGFRGFSPSTWIVREVDTGNFLQRPAVSWKPQTHTPQDIVDYLDEWMPQLDGICNLEFIESRLPVIDASLLRFDHDWLVVVLNRALNGWNPEADGWLFGPKHDNAVEIETQAKIDAVRTWIAEHPGGLRDDR